MLRLNALLAFISTALLSALLVGPLVGDTNPPAGPVSGTMKPLSQVEPRTPVESLPGNATAIRVISQPGSYYLTGNLLGVGGSLSGIEIASSNVSLDLNGFALIGGASSGVGVVATGSFNNIVIRNGLVSGWSITGIITSQARNGQIVDVSVEGCNTGMQTGANFLIRGCTARSNTGVGISLGSASTVVDCSSSLNLHGFSTSSGTGVQILDSLSHDNTSLGIFLNGFGGAVRNCVVTNNDGGGITASTGYQIIGNTCMNNGTLGGGGIHVNGTDNRVMENNVTGAARGYDIDSSGNFIAGNIASGNTLNYDIVPTQTIGPIITATGTITTTNPWANFEY
ncbi:MAG: right-handed parallel beta-helix repeat-containing protein [Planctomycetota bacterium]